MSRIHPRWVVALLCGALVASCSDERTPEPASSSGGLPAASAAVDAAPLSWREAEEAANEREEDAISDAFGLPRHRACLTDAQCGPHAACDKRCGAIRGRCVPVSTFCGRARAVECGCDGVSYINRCERLHAGVGFAHHGRCAASCSEAQGRECRSAGAVCIYPTGTCDDGERLGFCVDPPDHCPVAEAPVCGCDGVTYRNWCTLVAAGASAAHQGACERRCDGIQGLPCGEGEFCEHPPGECDVVDGAGVCVERPVICTREYAPVCGCDGKTYGNDCERRAAGAQLEHVGACEPQECEHTAQCSDPEGQYCQKEGCSGVGICADRPDACPDVYMPVCGCDGVTYGNACEAAAAGVNVVHEGACEPPPCHRNADCADGEWCKKPGCGDGPGVCTSRPDACLTVYMPVCACDGTTYGNGCFAAMDGQNVAHDGRCEPARCCNPEDEPGTHGLPQCFEGASCCDDGLWRCNRADGTSACNDRDPLPIDATPAEPRDPASPDEFRAEDPSSAFAETEPVVIPPGDSGGEGEVCEACCDGPSPLACPLPAVCCGDGHWACGSCDVIGHECRDRACGDSGDCRDDEVCKKAGCDARGECVPRPQACPDVYMPVCGCDGVTYGNACEAAAAGASVAHAGACYHGCGGLLGLPCADGQICDLPPGLCNTADASGVCVDKPAVCPLLIDPVCACDGVTYLNDCFRLMAGGQADHDGRCAPQHCCDPNQEPGTHGNPTCFEGASCCADGTWRCNSGDGSSTCGPISDPTDPRPASAADASSTDVVTVPPGGGPGEVCEACCSGPAPLCPLSECCADGHWSCGGCDVIGHACEARTCLDNGDCRAGDFCHKSGCHDGPGLCETRPQACPDVWEPVCGCDGETYGNRCEAAAAGVNIASAGACEQVCGGLLGVACPAGQYCDLPPGLCGGADFQGVCVEVGGFCPEIWAPVCGCDGTTYANDCFRVMARAQADHDGRCAPTHCCDPAREPGTPGHPACFEGASCCPNGEWQCNDAGGHSTCASTTSASARPAPPPEDGNICTACCDPNLALDCATAECCGDGRWTCGGCDVVGHVCEQRCAPVACTLACEFGFRVGADGCEICACRDRPAPSPGNP